MHNNLDRIELIKTNIAIALHRLNDGCLPNDINQAEVALCIADNALEHIINDLNDQGYRLGEGEPSLVVPLVPKRYGEWKDVNPDDTSTLDLKYPKGDPRRYKGDLLY